MSEQTTEFMATWVNTNIRPIPYALMPEVSKQLRLVFLHDAERRGIPKGELEAAAGCSVKRFITRALEQAQDRAVGAKCPNP
jgi:hypothetical protein